MTEFIKIILKINTCLNDITQDKFIIEKQEYKQLIYSQIQAAQFFTDIKL